MDFSNYKFRASSLGQLMVNARTKTGLSETTKGLLTDIFIEEVYGRKKDISNKYLDKGNFAEEDSLTLFAQQTGKFIAKNKKTYENDFVKGTPDVVTPKGIDIKTCWDIHTFTRKDGKDKDYYWQLWCYMWLTGLKTYDLVYTLVNSPEFLIAEEKQKQMYRKGLIGLEGSEEFDLMEKTVEKEMTFDDIPAEKRIKTFNFEFKEENIETVKARVLEAREFLNTLSL